MSILEIKSQLEKSLQSCQTVNDCIKVRESIMSDDKVLDIKKQMEKASGDQKKAIGKQFGEIRSEIYNLVDAKIKAIQTLQEQDNFSDYDPTFYSTKALQILSPKTTHPVVQTENELVEIFQKMGFAVFDGSMIEKQYYNFTSVGTPSYHPARGMQDTFFVEQKDEGGENYVMRTQVTSNIIRYAEYLRSQNGGELKVPFRVVFPGLVFRAENIDATHDINFHQFDMWLVDKTQDSVISISQLTTLLKNMFQDYFQDENLDVRVRPSYFPFTQPSLEVDIYCSWLKGGSWVEIGGAGPVHQDVIRSMGLDPKIYGGLAFGMGTTRMCQLKNKITGLGQFYSGDLEFLQGE